MKNTILIAIAVVAIIASAYMWYSYVGQPQQAALGRASTANVASAEVQDLLGILQTLQSIKIDAGYLNDPNFKILIDFAPTTAEPSIKGRPNPFIPASTFNSYPAQARTVAQ